MGKCVNDSMVVKYSRILGKIGGLTGLYISHLHDQELDTNKTQDTQCNEHNSGLLYP